jgi:hypothetical protein
LLVTRCQIAPLITGEFIDLAGWAQKTGILENDLGRTNKLNR